MESTQIQKVTTEPTILAPSTKPTPTWEFVTLPREKPFPANIFSLRHYTGLRALAIFFFLWAAISLSNTLYLVTFHRDFFTEQAQSQIENRGIIKKVWYWTKDFFWQMTPKPKQVHDNTDTNITHAILWGLFLLSLSWFFVWACFNWQHVRFLVFAVATFGFGALYNFTPGHMIDSEIPVVGEAETATVDVVAGGLSLAAIAEHLKKRRHQDMISRLIQDSPQAAITIALEEYGISVKRNQDTTSHQSA